MRLLLTTIKSSLRQDFTCHSNGNEYFSLLADGYNDEKT